ncbi:MAG: hypothetical protein MGG11_23245 [Trichodesmium sp. MAG_R03]|nr:hypothetical protein [Trichodesmium sp. MAG_R03]
MDAVKTIFNHFKIKKMKHVFVVLSCVLILLTSCGKDEPEIQLLNDDIFGFESVEEARTHLGVYADIFSPTNGSMYIRSTKFGTNTDAEQAEIFGRYQENQNQPRTNGGDFKFGDIKLSFDENTKSYLPDEGVLSNDEKVNRISNLFGISNEFSLIANGSTVINFEQYVPTKIDVNVESGIDYQGSNLLSISRNNCQISWNNDSNNENGIVAYLWWNGNKTDVSAFEQTQGKILNKAVKLNDEGQAVLSKELFNGIPKNAIVTLFFIRGNVNIKEVDGKSFKFYSVTQDKHNLILLD